MGEKLGGIQEYRTNACSICLRNWLDKEKIIRVKRRSFHDHKIKERLKVVVVGQKWYKFINTVGRPH